MGTAAGYVACQAAVRAAGAVSTSEAARVCTALMRAAPAVKGSVWACSTRLGGSYPIEKCSRRWLLQVNQAGGGVLDLGKSERRV
jgi:hypothetical protein